jgi:hypothetical protein
MLAFRKRIRTYMTLRLLPSGVGFASSSQGVMKHNFKHNRDPARNWLDSPIYEDRCSRPPIRTPKHGCLFRRQFNICG